MGLLWMAMSQMNSCDPRDGEAKINIKLNAEDEKYARAVRLAARALGMISTQHSAAAKRHVMQQLTIVESNYLHEEDTALASVAAVTSYPKLTLLPYFRKAASSGEKVHVDAHLKMKFKPTKLTLFWTESVDEELRRTS